MQNFIIGRIKSIKYAIKGFWLLVSTEHAIITHCITTLIFIVLGVIFSITSTEWMIQTLALGTLLAVEGLNTGLEKICDFIHPDFNKKIGEIKDVSAGAVSMIFFAVAIVLGIIYIPYIIEYFN
ncbi:MAG: diacylglycerol kinase family protein [Capnocytophaga sp.]|nr:diacylglycerol kinase family protein [Capnocytophaga sp.]